MSQVVLTDVVLRDGLQDEPVYVDVPARAEIARSLLDAGLRRLEVASFVNPKRVPQMAGAEELLAALPRLDGVVYSGLSLNPRGAERAVASGIDELNLVVSASDGHSRANAGRSTDAALAEIGEFCRAHPDVAVTGAVSTAFSSPFEPDGTVPAARIIAIATRLAGLGVTRIGLADTVGTGAPQHIEDVMRTLLGELSGVEFSLHLHDAHGRALDTVDRAVELGIVHFDGALGGYGGCPFAPGAHGNLATEALVDHLHRRGVTTGVDAAALSRAADLLRRALSTATPIEQPGER